MTFALHQHQADAIAFGLDRKASYLAHAMGAGKSRTTVEIAERSGAQHVLVVVPLRAIGVWGREFDRWGRSDWAIWAGQVRGARGLPKATATARERATALTRHVANHPRTVCVVGYDTARQPAMLRALLAHPWDLLVCDEIHRCKAATGRRSKAIAQIAERVRDHGGRILGLSGTPTPHSALDLYAQMRILDPTVYPETWSAHQDHYGQKRVKFRHPDGTPVYLTKPHGGPIYDGVQPELRDQLLDRARPLVHVVHQAELDAKLGLGEPTDNWLTIEPDPVTRRTHDQVRTDGIADLPNGQTLVAANALVVGLRLAQITGGAGTDEDGATWQLHDKLLDAPKARLLADLVADIPDDEPIVVFCWHRHDLNVCERVAAIAGRTYRELSGRRDDALTESAELAPGTGLAGVQIAAGGTGVDLTGARVGIYYSTGHNLGDYLQSRKRLHRQGQTRHVTLHHLAVTGTIDDAIHRALALRENTTSAIEQYLAGNQSQAVAA